MLECKYAGVRVIFIFCSSGIITHTSFGQISKDEIVNSEVLISRIGRNVDTSLGHYICQFYHMITLILLVIIFILRKIKIITSQYPGQNMLKYFPLSVLPRNLIRINFRIRVIMFLLIDKYMIQITLETKNYCLLVVIIVLDGEYHYLYHQKHHITIMDLE